MLRFGLLLLLFYNFLNTVSAQTELTVPDSLKGDFVLKGIIISGNKKTKERIIFREIPLSINDTISGVKIPEMCKRAQKNIYNLALFNFVEVQPAIVKESGNFYLKIDVVERWYLWPSPIFEIAETNFNTWWETRDFTRTNYGGYLRWENFRGHNDRLTAIAQFGYTKKFELRYSFPNLNKAQTIGIQFAGTIFQNREIAFATLDNKREFFNIPGGNTREISRARTTLTYRPNLYAFHRVELSFQKASTVDTILNIAPDYFNNNSNSLQFFAIQYDFIFDNRDYRYYPLNGLFFGVNLRQEGLGIVNNSLNLPTIYPFYKQFFKLSERLFYGHSLRGKYSVNNNIPYYRQQGLGYGEEVVRGYQYYIIDGQHYFLTKQNLKFMLIKPKKYSYKVTGISQFDKFHFALYVNLFFDSGYVWDNLYAENNPLSNQYNYATGIGFDFVSYYDTVMRLEIALNKQKESGFFVSFTQSL